MSGPLPDGAVDEFANTFKEWHYFVGGFALGFVAGVVFGSVLASILTAITYDN